MKLGIVGTGYVGLVTGACLAELGHTVYCIDKDESKISKLQQGIIPIYEPGLDDLVARNQTHNRLHFSTYLANIIDELEVIFLAVGTPPNQDYSADLSSVIEASAQIGQLMKKPLLIVTKSTVPVGTSDLVKTTIKKNLKKSCAFYVASNPEFLREGAAVKDFLEPDRIVAGVDTPEAEELLRKVYHPFIQDNFPFVVTDIRSSEVIKYAANAFLATKISFINEIANFCEVAGANIDNVAKGIGLDSRIGQKYLHAGIGYGGSCFPKDVKALLATSKKLGASLQILESVDKVNKAQQLRVIKKLQKHLPHLEGKTIAIWGLAFKAKTDDTREAPALTIIQNLLDVGAAVKAFDPVVTSLPLSITLADSPYAACENADALLIVTEWEDFLYPDFEQLKKLLKKPIIIDGRNLYDIKQMQSLGFIYDSIGRAS